MDRKRETSAANEEMRKKYSERINLDEGSMKSVKTKSSYVPDFFKPTPKPIISKNVNSPKSAGSMLMYEEIASKYRSNK